MTLKYSKRERTSKINESEGVCQSNLGTVWLTHFLNICDICVCDSGQVRTTLYNQRGIGRRGTTLMATTLLSARTKPGRQSTTFAIFATVSQQFRNSFATISQICTMHFCISGSVRFFPAFLSSSVLRVSSSMLKCVPKESVARDGGSTVQRTLWTLQTFNILTDLGTDAARCLPNF